MSEANSPMFARGQDDGLADAARVADGKEPFGPCPPNPNYPYMYLRGYYRAFTEAAQAIAAAAR